MALQAMAKDDIAKTLLRDLGLKDDVIEQLKNIKSTDEIEKILQNAGKTVD